MSDAIAGEPRYVASTDQVSTMVGGEAVILGMRDGVYFGLNVVGARVWTLLAEPRSASELVDTLVREFSADGARVKADVAALLSELRDRGLVQVVSGAPLSTQPPVGD